MDFTRARTWTQKLIPSIKRLVSISNDCLFCHFTTKSNSLICDTCQQDLDCFEQGYDLLQHNPKASGRVFDQYIDGINIVAKYQPPFSHVLPQFKFHQQIKHAKWLGHLMKSSLQHTLWQKPDLIIPIPLHAKRLAHRGYNQAELLSHFVDRKKLKNDVLMRVKYTNAQSELTRRERIHNLKHAFDCEQDLSGKTILLVDDVLTTGSTLNEAAKVLKQKGATTVYVAVVAIREFD